MKSVQEFIVQQQAQLSVHPFFQRLARNEPLRHVVPFPARMTFWVMTFQDILRLNESRVVDPALRKIAHHHRSEDAGHDRWFLADLLKVDGHNPDIRTVFAKPHASTRDGAYALMAEVFAAATDYERIILLLALESAGHVFFERVVSYFERFGVVETLQYFARSHMDVEKQHEVFEQEMNSMLGAITLEPSVQQRALAMVGRCYVAFSAIFDGLEEAILEAQRTANAVPAEQLLLHHEAQHQTLIGNDRRQRAE